MILLFAQDPKRAKCFPGSYFDFHLSSLSPNCLPTNRVDTSSIGLKDTEEILPVTTEAEINVAVDALSATLPVGIDLSKQVQQHNNQQQFIKELVSFPLPLTPPQPHSNFVNLLYLYPEFIKFEKFRNIACRVQFRSSDLQVGADGLKLIRGKSSTSAFTVSAMTQVNYHKKQLTPQDEIKIMLPLTLTPTSHLFFTFYKVSCKTNPGKREIIGYACLNLWNRNR